MDEPVDNGAVVDAAVADDAPSADVNTETSPEQPHEGVRVLQYSRSDLLI
jgi:hypothetical protein